MRPVKGKETPYAAVPSAHRRRSPALPAPATAWCSEVGPADNSRVKSARRARQRGWARFDAGARSWSSKGVWSLKPEAW